MKLKKPIKLIGCLPQADADFFKKTLEQASPCDWLVDTSRQDTWEAHRQTQSIVLVSGANFNSRKLSNQWTGFWRSEFQSRLMPFLTSTYGQGEIVRCVFSKLLPMSTISEHRDTEHLLHYSHRVHIPITTHPKVEFTINNETVHLKEGEVYEISNQDLHSVKSDWDRPRIHIILDYAEDRFKDILTND